jgi:hypothetical protein
LRRLLITLALTALLAAACGSGDDAVTTTLGPGPQGTAPTSAALARAEADALTQVELGGLRADLDYEIADSFISAGERCAAVIVIVDPDQLDLIVATAYMVRTEGRPAVEIFPRAEQMNPGYLEQWDAAVTGSEWGLLAMAPPETDVDDVITVCGGPFLDEALRRFVAVNIQPE